MNAVVKLSQKELEATIMGLRLAADSEFAHADCLLDHNRKVVSGYNSMYRSSMAASRMYLRIAARLEKLVAHE